jgi:Fe-Mn family superoxide dismutase
MPIRAGTYIDAATMELHHGKTSRRYVSGLNAAEAALAKARVDNDFAMAQYWTKRAAFNGGGHFLHSMFWKVMAPAGKGGGGEPDGALRDVINRDFGSFEVFRRSSARRRRRWKAALGPAPLPAQDDR